MKLSNTNHSSMIDSALERDRLPAEEPWGPLANGDDDGDRTTEVDPEI